MGWKSNHWCEIKPVLEKMIFFFYTKKLFFSYSYSETRPVLKRAWQGLSNERRIKWERSWGHGEKVMFLNQAEIQPLV